MGRQSGVLRGRWSVYRIREFCFRAVNLLREHDNEFSPLDAAKQAVQLEGRLSFFYLFALASASHQTARYLFDSSFKV